jgi:hypothetical protein
MLEGQMSDRLQLTDDEAFALLSLCMLSEHELDALSERAIRKLADFCRSHGRGTGRHQGPAKSELEGAG